MIQLMPAAAFVFFLALWLFPSCGGRPGAERPGSERSPNESSESDEESESEIQIDRDEAGPLRHDYSCNEHPPDSRRSRITIISRFDFVDSSNVSEYQIEGKCPYNGRYVQISVNGFSLDREPVCKRGRFALKLDLTPLLPNAKEVVFKVSQEEASHVVCRRARVSFFCPKNYVPVASLKGYAENSFCVMKYEAKQKDRSSGRASSIPEGTPISRASYDEAIAFCRDNGPQYDLINNSQWQTIARHIEAEDANWSKGRTSRAAGSALNCGNARGAPRAASRNDSDDCASSYKCKKGEWSYNKRTHVLPGGNIIWDFCGNIGEMMKDRNTQKYGFRKHVYLLSGEEKSRFGPKNKYSQAGSASRRYHYFGLGEADLSRRGSLIVRGDRGGAAGVFSVDLSKNQNSRSGSVGFRCVYTP